ncbi:MAG: glycosyltransferase [Oscillochloridaceae bacterium]|nr:glycosyltransferase [Chloroflexaceae bacterium]MDW8389821.1 glycosyltransferase [Oscillochloridaceae bacterium]
MSSLVSVIIPSYNSARYIASTVESALAQTYPAVEVIVVDDGSTDATQAVLAPYRSRITILHQTNRGPAAARNTGLRAAAGAYLLFLDSDDLLVPTSVAAKVAFLEQHPQYGLVYSAWTQISDDGARVLGEVRPSRQGDVLAALVRREFFFFPGAALIRRTCLDTVGAFDENAYGAEDADLWIRLARAGYAFGYIDEPLFMYRYHATSITGRVDPRQIASWQMHLARFFADTTLPSAIKALEDEAYAILHYETAMRYFRICQIDKAQEHLRQAWRRCPTLAQQRILDCIVGAALDPRTDDARALLDRVFAHLPEEVLHLRRLRDRVYGRYHVGMVFLYHQRRQRRHARRHLVAALRGEPQIVWNRGFLSIALRSLLP